jgi:site-specific recombinase XerD
MFLWPLFSGTGTASKPALDSEFQSIPILRSAVIVRIGELHGEGRGKTAVSVNTYLRCLKAFLKWCHEQEIVKEPFKLVWLKEEHKLLVTLTPEQITRIINWKPVGSAQSRLHALILTALDTGMRIHELPGLRRADVDFENFVLRVKGKGNKHPLVPMGIELRKCLYRYLSKHQFDHVLPTQGGTQLLQRNVLRDFKQLCGNLGITGVRLFVPYVSAYFCC